MSEHLPAKPEFPELPNPPELKAETHESLARQAMTVAIARGEKLSVGRVDYPNHDTAGVRSYVHFNTANHPRVSPFTDFDTTALFAPGEKLDIDTAQVVGSYASLVVSTDELPFRSSYDTLQVDVATFSESVMALTNDKSPHKTDLPGLPLAAIQLGFTGVGEDPDTHEKVDLDHEWMSYLLFAPDKDGKVNRALRVRKHGSWYGTPQNAPDDSENRALHALTGHEYPWLLKTRASEYDFSEAAIEMPHVSGLDYDDVVNGWDWMYVESADGYRTLEGKVGEDGAKMLQRLLEIALRDGKPTEPVEPVV